MEICISANYSPTLPAHGVKTCQLFSLLIANYYLLTTYNYNLPCLTIIP
jgi:hypothetical protein